MSLIPASLLQMKACVSARRVDIAGSVRAAQRIAIDLVFIGV
jgi:hypothetical protein